MTVLENVTQMRLPLEVAELVEEKETNKDLNKNQLLMKQVLDDLGNMPYYPNGKKEHEKAVREILLSHGMVEKFKGKYGKGRKGRIEPFLEQEKCPDGAYFIWQPHGSQRYPDFYLFFDGVKITLECKSTKSGKIMWNSGYPREGGIYIFADGDQDKNYLFMGEDHCNLELVADILNFQAKQKKEAIGFNKKMEKKYGKTKLKAYPRAAVTDSEIISTTDTDKKLKNVYDYFYKELK